MITIDVLPGLVIGVVGMLLLVVYRASRPHLAELARVPGVRGAYGAIGRHPDFDRIPGLLVLRLETPLWYANASLVVSGVKRFVSASDQLPKAVIIDVGANDDLGITSLELLEQLVDSLRAAGIDFALADVRQPVIEVMQRSSLFAKIGENRIFHTVDEAVEALATTSPPPSSRCNRMVNARLL